MHAEIEYNKVVLSFFAHGSSSLGGSAPKQMYQLSVFFPGNKKTTIWVIQPRSLIHIVTNLTQNSSLNASGFLSTKIKMYFATKSN